MSVNVMGWVWDRSNSVGNDRLVLLAIADHAGKDGRNAWPGVQTLAEMANVSERTVQRSLRALVDAGELLIEYRAGGQGDLPAELRPNRYTVLLAHRADRTQRARKKRARHLVTTVSPPPATESDTNVVSQVADPGAAADSHPVTRLSPGSAADPVTAVTSPGDTVVTHPVTPEARPGDTVVTQSVLEPSYEPSTEPRARVVAHIRTLSGCGATFAEKVADELLAEFSPDRILDAQPREARGRPWAIAAALRDTPKPFEPPRPQPGPVLRCPRCAELLVDCDCTGSGP